MTGKDLVNFVFAECANPYSVQWFNAKTKKCSTKFLLRYFSLQKWTLGILLQDKDFET